MGRLSNITRRAAVRRFRRGRLVLWGGRRCDWNLGGERDRATLRLIRAHRQVLERAFGTPRTFTSPAAPLSWHGARIAR